MLHGKWGWLPKEGPRERELEEALDMTDHYPKSLLIFVLVAGFSTSAYPCTIARRISSREMVSGADAIVRAIAVEYSVPPSQPDVWTSGVPDSKIRFHVVENISGSALADFSIPGYLVDKDDFNDQPSPYEFVRPGGRGGSCFANSYRSKAQFLLLLKKTKEGELTVNWCALAPVNEQLRSDDDPWLLWVRERVKERTQR